MNRFLLFAGDGEPRGGWSDFISSHVTLRDAQLACPTNRTDCSWAEIVDLHEQRVVMELHDVRDGVRVWRAR